MSARLRHALVAVAIVALALLSHGRLFRAGWLGSDLRLLDEARLSTTDHGARALWLDEGDVRPVPAAVLVAHECAFAERGVFSPLYARSLRIVSMVVLLAAAAIAGFALRRAIAPWVGGDTARAGGFALALFFATHPLGTAAVARPGALGDLLALFFSGLAAFLFLRGRQQREKHWVLLAGLAAVLAGFSSPIAVLLPCVLAALELGSARRPRPLAQRLRTAATTLFVFAGCVLVESACAVLMRLPARDGFAGTVPGWPDWSDVPHTIEACIEKLGILFFPVAITDTHIGSDGTPPITWPSYLVSVALVLLASWPVLRSARAAPRVWGWLALTWIVGMAIALVPRADLRVEPGDYTYAHILIAATLFACSGLAVASTALLGTRRILLPAAIAVGFAWLGSQAAGGFVTASDYVSGMHRDVLEARAKGGPRAHVLIVDPISRRANLDLELDDARRLVDRHGGAPPPAFDPCIADGNAVELFARTPEMSQWRTDGLVLVGRDDSELGERDGPDRRHELFLVPPTEGSGPPVTWQHKSQSGVLDLDPAATHAARVVAQVGASTAAAPEISWRTSDSTEERPELFGVWLEGPDAPIAVFDLAKSWSWWRAASVRNVSIQSPFRDVLSAELVSDIPLAAQGPESRGDDWTFRVDRTTLPKPVRGQALFMLELLDLATFEHAQIHVASVENGERLVLTAPGAAGFERKVRARGTGPIVWSLDRRVGDTTIARASGRN